MRECVSMAATSQSACPKSTAATVTTVAVAYHYQYAGGVNKKIQLIVKQFWVSIKVRYTTDTLFNV